MLDAARAVIWAMAKSRRCGSVSNAILGVEMALEERKVDKEDARPNVGLMIGCWTVR